MRIHEVLETTLKSTRLPASSTTLAEIQAITLAPAKVNQIGQGLQELYHRVSVVSGSDLAKFLKQVGRYLQQVKQVCEELSKVIATANRRELELALEKRKNLEIQAQEMNHETEELLKKYAISDEEAHYTYRKF